MKTTSVRFTAEPKRESSAERAARKRASIKPSTEWLKAFGSLEDSEFTREAWSLGEASRKAQTKP